MKIAIACDFNAIQLKNALLEVLKAKDGIEFKDFGVFNEKPVDYPDVAAKLVPEIQNKNFDRGILICGTGIGMAICANKFKGIRAAVCHDLYSAQRSILSNDCQILCMGSLIIGKSLAQEILKVWISIERTGGTVAKVKKIEAMED
jgi:ribose 5-phosphate isomerase B